MYSLAPVHRVLLARIDEGVLITYQGRWAWSVEHRKSKRAAKHHVFLSEEQIGHVYYLIDAGLVVPPKDRTPAQVVCE